MIRQSRLLAIAIAFILPIIMLVGCAGQSPTPSTPAPTAEEGATESTPKPMPETSTEVSSPRSVPGPDVELGYDTGISTGSLAMGSIGYAIKYEPDCDGFVIRGVKIYGNLYGAVSTIHYAEIRIVDQNLQTIYTSTIEHALFTEKANWVLIGIPDIVVDGSFYVFLQTNSPRSHGITVGYDSSFPNENSDIIYDWKLADWTTYLKEHPKHRFNWMIRVIGASTDFAIPVTSPLSPQIPSWNSMTLEDVVAMLDTPEKLSQSMLVNMTFESTYERWKETGVNYIAAPEEIFKTGKGSCTEFAVFSCYVLQYHKYEAEILVIIVETDISKNHSVCVYYSSGPLYTINNGEIKGPYETYEDIASGHDERWSEYRIYYSWDKFQKLGAPDKVVLRNQ